MLSIGWMELMIILALGGGVAIALLCLCIPLFFGVHMHKTKRAAGGAGGRWDPSGQPVRIQAMGPSDKPIAGSATWDGSELVVRSEDWASKALFDVILDDLEQCIITYRFCLKTENLQKAVYPEMWCRIPERGQFFSRGLHRKVRGTNDWKEIEIQFLLENGQQADLLHLNLVFQGPGVVWLKDIEVLSTPVKPTG